MSPNGLPFKQREFPRHDANCVAYKDSDDDKMEFKLTKAGFQLFLNNKIKHPSWRKVGHSLYFTLSFITLLWFSF